MWFFSVICKRGGSYSWIRKSFCSHCFMIFPHKGGLESPLYLLGRYYPVLIQKDLQHFVIFSDDSKHLTTPSYQFAFFCMAVLLTVSMLDKQHYLKTSYRHNLDIELAVLFLFTSNTKVLTKKILFLKRPWWPVWFGRCNLHYIVSLYNWYKNIMSIEGQT